MRGRSISSNFANNFINALSNYGCWCYFGENVGKGRGPAVDEWDQACKVLGQGYECAVMDGASENEPCEPWSQETVPDWKTSNLLIFNYIGDPAGLKHRCEQDNAGNNCAIRTCIIEGNFLLEYTRLSFSNTPAPNPIHKHENGFDPQDQINCPINTQINGEAEEACCGFYPERRPFRLKLGERECCEQNNIATVYRASLFSCCPDGSISPSC